MEKNMYLVRWTDKDGTKKTKQYTDYLTAKKALKWLLDNGSDDCDIAIVLNKKEESEESA